MQHKIVIRVDGGSTIGLGHIVRCIALAQILKNDFVIQFVCIAIPDEIIKDLRAHDFFFLKIKSENDFFKILEGNEIVIIDSNVFDMAYQNQIKQIGCKLVCIDDLHDKDYVADVIINHSPGQSSDSYNLKAYTKLAIGIEYALLRPSFYNAAKQQRNITNINSVLICLGGADPKNITKDVLQVISIFKEFKEINVVLGSSYVHKKSLEPIVNSNSNIKIKTALGEHEMAEVMSSVDLAIVSASGTLFEVLATGAIPLICYYAENQMELFYYFKNKRNFHTFNVLEFDENDLKSIINQLLEDDICFSGLEEKKYIEGAPKRLLNLFKKI